MGEFFITNSVTATSANFYGDYMEEINAPLTDAELREKAQEKNR